MANRFWVGGTATWDSITILNWALTSGGIGGATVPGAADVAIFDTASGTVTVSTDATTATVSGIQITGANVNLSLGANLTTTGTFTFTTGTLSLNSHQLNCNIFSSANSNTRVINFGTGNITVTGNAATVWNTATATNFSHTGTSNVNFTYSGSTGTRSIAQANAANGGTESNALNMNISAGSDIVAFGGVTRIYKNVDFTGFAGTYTSALISFAGNLTFSTGMTVSSSTANSIFSATSGTSLITTNGKTLDFPIQFNGVGGTFAFQDALTQGSTRAFTITNGTVQLKNGVTSTVGSFVANNSSVKFLQSTTLGSQATLSQASSTVNVVDLTIRDINAVGGASWNAYTDFENTDAGNNDGWNFSLSPPYSTAELPVTLRPFTQPRRF